MRVAKISYLQFSRKVSILQHMLLHNSYINVAIANILPYRKSPYDLPVPKYKNLDFPDLSLVAPKSVFRDFLEN